MGRLLAFFLVLHDQLYVARFSYTAARPQFIMCRPIASLTHAVAETFTVCAAVHYLCWKKQFLVLFTFRLLTIRLMTCRENRAFTAALRVSFADCRSGLGQGLRGSLNAAPQVKFLYLINQSGLSFCTLQATGNEDPRQLLEP